MEGSSRIEGGLTSFLLFEPNAFAQKLTEEELLVRAEAGLET